MDKRNIGAADPRTKKKKAFSIHLHPVIYHALQVAYLVLSLVQKLFLEAFLLKQQESFPA